MKPDLILITFVLQKKSRKYLKIMKRVRFVRNFFEKVKINSIDIVIRDKKQIEGLFEGFLPNYQIKRFISFLDTLFQVEY